MHSTPSENLLLSPPIHPVQCNVGLASYSCTKPQARPLKEMNNQKYLSTKKLCLAPIPITSFISREFFSWISWKCWHKSWQPNLEIDESYQKWKFKQKKETQAEEKWKEETTNLYYRRTDKNGHTTEHDKSKDKNISKRLNRI